MSGNNIFMNIQEKKILVHLGENHGAITQRHIALLTGYSLGSVNKAIQSLNQKDLIDKAYRVTQKGYGLLEERRPKRAIILAAGFGLRMIPINTEIPKGLLEIRGERLIERIIRQLHAKGITEIYVVVGFLKEKYEYLIDSFGVELIVNMSYASKNNLHSLFAAQDHLEDAYIIPCDVWVEENPFRKYELSSWYMVTDSLSRRSSLGITREGYLSPVSSHGNEMIGIAFFNQSDAAILKQEMKSLVGDERFDSHFWEDALIVESSLKVVANVFSSKKVLEINTFEQLRAADSHSDSLDGMAIRTITDVLNTQIEEITDVTLMKKGMTNRSFLFSCNGERYIMRIPGEGTEQLIDRCAEHVVYETIKDRELCDETIYFNPDQGYKISRFLNQIRVCNPKNQADVSRCIKRLREFHQMKLEVSHYFDIREQIEFYESLWMGNPSVFADYPAVKERVLALQPFIDSLQVERCLTHIDAVPDNFLISEIDDTIWLIDWEYAAMQDPHLDLAMFSIYSFYTRKQIDWLMDVYFEGNVRDEVRLKIYAYVAMAGLLWSNWSEYKRNLGVEFGEYTVRQYRYAKEYSRIVHKELKHG